LIINNLNDNRVLIWDIQKNIGEEEKSAQRKDELEKETKKDSPN